jgi:septum site-determining protein MinC
MKHDEVVIFKGNLEGLRLVLDDEISYTLLLERLREKLNETAGFFKGAKVIVYPGKRELQPAQYFELSDIMQKEYGLILLRWVLKDEQETAIHQPEPPNTDYEHHREVEPLILYRTVRSGQEISHKGSILLLGDVNYGASVVAGGDITILGVCRGAAHAGSYGNTRAWVAAYRLQPTQLRIANVITCAPDGANPPAYPEIARMKNGEVVIEPAILR